MHEIWHINIRGLPKHLDELKLFMQDERPLVVFVSETFLSRDSSVPDTVLNIPGYTFVRKDRPCPSLNGRRHRVPARSPGGGLIAYFDTERAHYTRLTQLENDNFETMWFDLHTACSCFVSDLLCV